MSSIPLLIGTTADTGATVTYTFTNSVDTTTLQPGQAFDIRSYLIGLGVIKSANATTHLTIVINSGVTLYSSNASYPALTIANFHPSRDRVKLINNGYIYGAGGAGGAGGYQSGGSNGGSGGVALNLSSSTTIYNNGSIIGGGGGNGGDGGLNVPVYGYVCNYGNQYVTCGGPNNGNDCYTGGGQCVRQGCGGCQTNCCGWTCCLSLNNGNCHGCPNRNGYQGYAYYATSYYTQTGTSYYVGTAGGGGSIGAGTAGATGAANSYYGGSGGIYGNDIVGYYAYANIVVAGTTAGHFS